MKRLFTTPYIALVACSVLLLAGLTWSALDLSNQPAPQPVVAQADPVELPQLRCTFTPGEQRAYTIQNNVTVAQITDRFDGTLSMEVVQQSDEGTILRAAITDLTLTQELSQTDDRTGRAAIESKPFFMVIDDTCAFGEIGFTDSWDTSARQLVTTVLRAQEIVLSQETTPTWSVTQRDGGGTYVAHYTAESAQRDVQITRTKHMYEAQTSAKSFGIELSVLSSETTAMFEPEQGSLESIRGEEHVKLTLPSGTQVLSQRFSMMRHDAAFLAIAKASMEDADFRDALDLPSKARVIHEEPIQSEFAAMTHGEARVQFLAFFAERGDDGVLPAAKLLARWMRADPGRAAMLLDDLREGRIPEHTHAALFLGFELAGDDASREALISAIKSDDLTELNRARAASALSDHGVPTERAAKVLQAHAKKGGSPMVSTVSKLGLGTMASQAQGPLQEQLFEHLGTELSGAQSRKEIVTAIDAIGNSANDAFAPALIEELTDEEPSIRAHAAEALGRLSPEVGRTALITQLEKEEEPQVISSLLNGVMDTDKEASQLSREDLILATELLQSSHTGVRGQVIGWLGHFSPHQEVKVVLASHFHKEKNLALKQLIGQFLTAAELRGH